MLRKPSLFLLREDQGSVDDDVELALASGLDLGLVLRLGVQLGRETRGPVVVAVSDGAVEDADSGHQIVLNCSKGWRQLSQYRNERHGVGPKMFSRRVSVEPQ
jgi:hypothetical protein